MGDVANIVELSSDSSLLNNIPHWTRTKRSASNNRYVELMLVADRYTTQRYGDFTEQYLLSVAYLVSRNDAQLLYTHLTDFIINNSTTKLTCKLLGFSAESCC